MDIIGLALIDINGKRYIFETPKYCLLEDGDTVMCDTKTGKMSGTVVKTANVVVGGEEYELITRMDDETLPLRRVVSKVVVEEIHYEDEER